MERRLGSVSTYAVITSAFGTGPAMHIIIAFDDDPDEALRFSVKQAQEEMDI